MPSEPKEMLKFEQPESFSPARITADITHVLSQRGKKKQTSGNQMESCPGERCLLSPAQTMFWVAWPDLAIGTQNLEALAPSTEQLQCSHTALHPGLLSTLKGEKKQTKTKHTRKSGNSLLNEWLSQLTASQGHDIRHPRWLHLLVTHHSPCLASCLHIQAKGCSLMAF